MLDGAIAAALVRGDPAVARAAGDAARVLLAAAGVEVPGDRASAGASSRRRAAPHLHAALASDIRFESAIRRIAD